MTRRWQPTPAVKRKQPPVAVEAYLLVALGMLIGLLAAVLVMSPVLR